MKFIKNIALLTLFAAALLLGACSDVESMGDPQPRAPRVEVESDAYYVQITKENINGVAFVYRWLDMETAAKYAITLECETPQGASAASDRKLETPDGASGTSRGASAASDGELETSDGALETPDGASETLDATIQTLKVEDKSVLTYNGVRELLFTNRQIMEYMTAFGITGKEAHFTITLEAFQADGTPITSDAKKQSQTSSIDIILAPDVDPNSAPEPQPDAE